MDIQTILITGAAGNLGSKLRRHLEGRYHLKLLDITPGNEPAIFPADLSHWNQDWVKQFQDVDAVVHLAAEATAKQTWDKLIGPNVDGVVHMYQAAIQAGVKRIVFASSNHVMGGYKDEPATARITNDSPPRPGTHYVVNGEPLDSTPYGSAKLFGERIGKCLAEIHGISVIAVRIGWVRPGDNRAQDVPLDRGPWFQQMWLSNRDFCQLMERCILAELPSPFAVVNGMSANTGMPWDIEATHRLVGYKAMDDVTRKG